MSKKLSPHVSRLSKLNTFRWRDIVCHIPLLPFLDGLDPYEFFVEQEIVENF
jgi:hypothetical protein